MLVRLLTFLVIVLFSSSVWAQGYSIQGEKILVNARRHWEAWRLPWGAVEITVDGKVSPKFIRKDVNVTADVSQFLHYVDKDFIEEFPFRLPYASKVDSMMGRVRIQGGIKNAGSNVEDAPNILDGDPHTFWGPDLGDDLEDWWVEVDLGRLATVTKIILRFVDEEEGDVFKAFKVSTSRGQPAYFKSKNLGWTRIFKSRRLDPTQRVFEITPEPTPRKNYEGQGDEIQCIRIQATEKADKGKEVSREEYEVMPLELRGPLEYYKRTPLGEERVISEEGYRSLYPEEKGPIRYYRIQLPRLAEIEVWGVGDNISLGTLERGGSARNTGTYFSLMSGRVIDGSYVTYGSIQRFDKGQGLLIDLGAVFWIDTIRALMPQRELRGKRRETFIPSYKVMGSDGTRTPEGDFVWEALTPKSRETMEVGSTLVRVEDTFDPHRVRFFMIEFFVSFFTLAEFQAYGEGYLPGVTLESPVIELGPNRALSFIHWEGDAPPGTGLVIRTRTGDTLKEAVRYFDADGNEITERHWGMLPPLLKLPPVIELVPGDDWTTWSAPYGHSGDLVTSPSPRNYLQIQVKLLSEDPKARASIGSLTVDWFPPLVQQAIGEIAPSEIQRAGAPQVFSAFIKAEFLPRNRGFDQLLLTCPYNVDMRLVEVNIGSQEEFEAGQQERISEDTLKLLRASSDSIWIRLPQVMRPLKRNLMEIQFESTVFLKGTPFEIFLINSNMPGFPQRVISGDATSLVDSQRMMVTVPVDRRIIGDVSVTPNPFTPNGDGINDETSFNFSVFNADIDKPIDVVIYNLGGSVIRRITDRRPDISGRHSVVWDGRDEYGSVVSPGIYLVRISLDVDSDMATDTAVNRAVCVAY